MAADEPKPNIKNVETSKFDQTISSRPTFSYRCQAATAATI